MKTNNTLKLPDAFMRDISQHVKTLITNPKLLNEAVPPKTAALILQVAQEIADEKRKMTAKEFSNFVRGKEEIYADYRRCDRWWISENQGHYREMLNDINTENCRLKPHCDGLFPSRP